MAIADGRYGTMPNAFLVSQAHRLAPAIRAGVFEPPGEAVSARATQALPTQVGNGDRVWQPWP